jgi:hypothetical protein
MPRRGARGGGLGGLGGRPGRSAAVRRAARAELAALLLWRRMRASRPAARDARSGRVGRVRPAGRLPTASSAIAVVVPGWRGLSSSRAIVPGPTTDTLACGGSESAASVYANHRAPCEAGRARRRAAAAERSSDSAPDRVLRFSRSSEPLTAACRLLRRSRNDALPLLRMPRGSGERQRVNSCLEEGPRRPAGQS